MRRLVLFAHFDPAGAVRPHILHHLRALRAIAERVVFVSTSSLSSESQTALQEMGVSFFERPNEGFDFGSWKEALARESSELWDEIVFTNSSIVGPLAPGLEHAFEVMAPRDAAIWAMTDSVEERWHLQSFFLVFRRQAIASAAFQEFWESVSTLPDKRSVILAYELGVAEFFQSRGLTCVALATTAALGGGRPWLGRQLAGLSPPLWAPEELLALGMPYVKVELLRDNPLGVSLTGVRRAIEAVGLRAEADAFGGTTVSSLRRWGRYARFSLKAIGV